MLSSEPQLEALRSSTVNAPRSSESSTVAHDANLPLLSEVAKLREELSRFLMQYKFGIDEVLTKITILQEEFLHLHEHNPIEHVNSRLKSPESIIGKIGRKGLDPSFDSIREAITDIAGVRITCSFIADAYRVFDLLTQQSDIRVIEVKDYIKNPKPNGYRSLHAIIEIPVFMSDRVVPVTVELQIRTIAMDFWASLEHKIYYKYDGQVPAALLGSLTETADIAADLDLRMERLHHEVLALNSDPLGQIALDRGPATPVAGGNGTLDDTLVVQLQSLRSLFGSSGSGPAAH